MHVTDLGQGALLIKNCIISYPHLFTPRAAGRPGAATGEPKYSANFILPADLDAQDNAILNAAFEAAVSKVWPKGAPQSLKSCWKDAGTADQKFAGRLMISASANADQPPGVFSPIGRLGKEEQSQIFAGCVVNAHVRIYAYTRGHNGVTWGLNDVQLVDNQNVQRLDGRKSGAEVFGVPDDSFPTATAPVPNQPGPQVPQQQQVTPPAPQPQAPAPQPTPTPGFLD